MIAAAAAVAAMILVFVLQSAGPLAQDVRDVPPWDTALPTTSRSYIGVYPGGVPESYAGVTAFTAATGVTPRLVPYYSGWLEPFQARFAATAARHGAVPVVQIDPTRISLARIASGHYDSYLTSYAMAVRDYHHPVVISFGHEMNGTWYSWGYRHAPARAFVAAWRHIVTLFRARGARNVTWLWTINVGRPLQPWWPGTSYVTWVGIDGYYYDPTSQFAPLFGPTIAAVREITRDPILIAETGAAPAAGQPAKITGLFAGVRAYGLLGFIWFDTAHIENWQITTPAAINAFRRAATMTPTP